MQWKCLFPEGYNMFRLKETKGESIAEVLLASLVISLGFVMLVSMIMASFHMIKNSEEKYKSHNNVKNVFEAAPQTIAYPEEDAVSVISQTEKAIEMKYLADTAPTINVNREQTYGLNALISSITSEDVTVKKFSYAGNSGPSSGS